MQIESIALDRRCRTSDELHRWILEHTGLRVARAPVCADHSAPFDYIAASYFESAGDLVVWAPRGGGKTTLAAVATLLDLLHKPGCQVRILGGSLEQSLRLWEHLHPLALRLAEDRMVGASRTRRLELDNGSAAAVLTQSQRSVRGQRIQKLRCDEVDLFDPDVWEAAQLVTQSKVIPASAEDESGGNSAEAQGGSGESAPPRTIRGAIEALSTFHATGGLMNRLIEAAPKNGTPVIQWCLLEVLEKCPPERECAGCPLFDECRGVAKTRCDGFLRIDDAIAMKKRVSRETWEAEMLCRRPSRRGRVFPDFLASTHVREDVGLEGEGARLAISLDFGYSNPFVCLWIVEHKDKTVHVIDEYVQPQRMMHEHIAQIRTRTHGEPALATCDPAGSAANDQTAQSNVKLLRDAGYAVKSRKSLIVEGLEMVRAALMPAAGPAKLFIHPRCGRLVKAFGGYRYAPGGSELPIKDNEHDHLIDALRYYFVNTRCNATTGSRRY